MDGNTDDKDVQEKFVGTLTETMKGDNFPVYREDGDDTVDRRDGPERPGGRAADTAGPAAVARPNGFIPNKADVDANARLRYNVREMYAQIGQNDSVL